MKRIVILGAGTGGTAAANHLRKEYSPEELDIIVVDRNNLHIYQPGLLFVPFGIYKPDDIIRPRIDQLASGIRYTQSEIKQIDPQANQVSLSNGDTYAYDVLVIATGTELLPQETEGLTGTGWQENIFDFYSLDGAVKLASFLDIWQGGKLVVNVVDMPIK